MTTRRSFLKQSCASAGCACAFAGLAALPAAGAPAPPDDLTRRWVARLIPALGENTDRGAARAILRSCGAAHYDALAMDAKVAPYAGRLDDFLAFLSRDWGWKIERQPGSILIDEGKPRCVCPLVGDGASPDLALLCDCSEGFAERMFSAVVGRPVKVEVARSILRGAPTCHYRLTLPPGPLAPAEGA